MTAAAEERLWGLAAAVSVALHIAAAFALFQIPVQLSAAAVTTNIVLLSSQTRTVPAVKTASAATAGTAQAVSLAPLSVDTRVDRTAVTAVAETLASGGIEHAAATRTAPDAVGSNRHDPDAVALAPTVHRPVGTVSGFEMAAVRREEAPIAPGPLLEGAPPRPPSEAARPFLAMPAEPTAIHLSGAQPAESATAAQSPLSRPARPVAGPGEAPAFAGALAHPPVAPAARIAVVPGGETSDGARAPDAARPSSPPPAQTAGHGSAIMSVPAAQAEPAQTWERIAAIVRPLEPAIARSREDIENAYLDLLSTLRALRGESCVLALARLVGQSARIDGFAVTAAGAVQLDQRLRREAILQIDHRRHTVTDAQCAALDFAASLTGYPEPGLSIDLESAEIASGAVLSGRVTNLLRPWAHLVIVDDEGRVHELQEVAVEEEGISFQAPVTLTDGSVATVQILLAMNSDTFLVSIGRNDGQEAGSFFEALSADIERDGGQVDFGMAPFVVR